MAKGKVNIGSGRKEIKRIDGKAWRWGGRYKTKRDANKRATPGS